MENTDFERLILLGRQIVGYQTGYEPDDNKPEENIEALNNYLRCIVPIYQETQRLSSYLEPEFKKYDDTVEPTLELLDDMKLACHIQINIWKKKITKRVIELEGKPKTN